MPRWDFFWQYQQRSSSQQSLAECLEFGAVHMPGPYLYAWPLSWIYKIPLQEGGESVTGLGHSIMKACKSSTIIQSYFLQRFTIFSCLNINPLVVDAVSRYALWAGHSSHLGTVPLLNNTIYSEVALTEVRQKNATNSNSWVHVQPQS